MKNFRINTVAYAPCRRSDAIHETAESEGVAVSRLRTPRIPKYRKPQRSSFQPTRCHNDRRSGGGALAS